jgi:hypothetical protein
MASAERVMPCAAVPACRPAPTDVPCAGSRRSARFRRISERPAPCRGCSSDLACARWGDRRAERGVDADGDAWRDDGDAHVVSEDRTEDTSILDSFEIVEIPATLPTTHPHALSAATVTVAFTDVLAARLQCSAHAVHCMGPYLDALVHCDQCAVTAHVCQSIMAAELATRTRHIPIVTVSQRCRPSLSRLPVVPV